MVSDARDWCATRHTIRSNTRRNSLELAQIKEGLGSIPFRAFTLRLVDGREYFVPHRDFLYIPPNMLRTVCFANTQTHAVTILDAGMIASIGFQEDPAEDPSPAKVNGSHNGPDGPRPV